MNAPQIQPASTPTTAAQVLDASGSSVSPLTQAAPPAPEASKAIPAADEKVSGKLQMLIQREKTAVERERAANAKEAAAAAREQALAEREAKIQEFESIKAKNPRRALELLGMSYQDLTQVELSDGEVPADLKVKRVEEKFDSFLKSQEDAKRQSVEDAQKQQERETANTIAKFQTEIGTYLKENVGRYELIEFEQSQSLVYDVIDEHYNRTLEAAMKTAQEAGEDVSEIRGEIMTIAQAADKVEAHLEKKYDQARNLSKVKVLMAPRPVAPSPADKLKTGIRQTPKTLNNNLSATPATPRKAPITDDERVAKAIEWYRGQRTAP